MIDFFNLANNSHLTKIFYANNSSTTTPYNWQAWNKPQNANMVLFYLIGGGGGGGAGRNSSGNTAPGGGGGGSSSITIGLFPAVMIPDTLYVSVGAGGDGYVVTATGTANGGAGSSGKLSYISLDQNITLSNLFLVSGTAAAAGGGGTTSTNAGSGGAAGTSWKYDGYIFTSYGIIQTYNGQSGSAGGNGTSNATNITPNLIVTGGAGGGGVDASGNGQKGGDITGVAIGFFPTLSGAAAVTNTTASIVSSGYALNIPTSQSDSNSRFPSFFMGGTGGGAMRNTTNGAKAGNGGNGSYGCGGGGGGGGNGDSSLGGTIYNIGGNGGRGGDGLVIISCF